MHAKLSWSLVVGAVLLGAMSGCAESSLRMSPDFGVALRQDLAAQTVDPQGVGAAAPYPLGDGARAALAMGRYEKGEVKEPALNSTTEINMRNGQGGGQSGGR